MPQISLKESYIRLREHMLRRFPNPGKTLFRFTSICYQGSLKYYTEDPIEKISRRHELNADKRMLRQALVDFRHGKEKELTFVGRAAGLSAAAVIAAFTWPALEHTHWVTTMLWHWSLTCSIFSLISSAQDRLLAIFPKDLPDDKDRGAGFPEGKDGLETLLPLVTGPMMFWVWQTPLMLMNYAWVLFLMGYFLLILAPLFDGRNVNLTPLAAGITAGVCFLLFLHFVMCAWVTMRRYKIIAKKRRQNSMKLDESV